MNFKYLILIFTLLSINLNAQENYFKNYYPLLDSSRFYFAEKEYERSKEFLELAFTANHPRVMDYHDLALINFKLGNTEESIRNLKTIYIRYNRSIEEIEEFILKKLDDNLLDNRNWKNFKSNLSHFNMISLKYFDQRDTSLIDVLEKMVDEDQKYRQPGKSNWSEQNKIDSLNIQNLITLVKENNGWFSYDQIGDLFPFMIALHIENSNTKDTNKVLEFFKITFDEACKKGILTRHLRNHFLNYSYSRKNSNER